VNRSCTLRKHAVLIRQQNKKNRRPLGLPSLACTCRHVVQEVLMMDDRCANACRWLQAIRGGAKQRHVQVTKLNFCCAVLNENQDDLKIYSCTQTSTEQCRSSESSEIRRRCFSSLVRGGSRGIRVAVFSGSCSHDLRLGKLNISLESMLLCFTCEDRENTLVADWRQDASQQYMRDGASHDKSLVLCEDVSD
jgi:hypothetical protein